MKRTYQSIYQGIMQAVISFSVANKIFLSFVFGMVTIIITVITVESSQYTQVHELTRLHGVAQEFSRMSEESLRLKTLLNGEERLQALRQLQQLHKQGSSAASMILATYHVSTNQPNSLKRALALLETSVNSHRPQEAYHSAKWLADFYADLEPVKSRRYGVFVYNNQLHSQLEEAKWVKLCETLWVISPSYWHLCR